MVLRRRSEYGFVGHDALVVPRARRSIRKKASCKKTFDEGQLCAFDLLATVAGKLLQEVESCSASSSVAVGLDHVGSHKNQFIKQEMVEGPLRNGQDDHGSSEESVVSSGVRSPKSTKKEVNTVILKSSSTVDSSCSMKMGCSDVKSVTDKSDDEFVQTPSKIDGGSPKYVESLGAVNVDDTTAVGEGDDGLDDVVSAAANKFRSKDNGVRLCEKSPPQINSNGDTNIIFEQLPLERGSPVSDASFVRHRNDIKIGRSRDDDEILSQSSDPSSVHLKSCQSTTPVGEKGISKILTSKYWKSGPELKDCEVTNSGSKLNNIYRNKKPFYSQERFQHHDAPFKKRKLVGQSSVLTQDAGVSSESASNVTDKGVIDDKSSPMLKPQRDKGVSSPTIDRQRSFTSRSSRVKLSIKSFTVPELLIEVPESTSVGSLKKTIVEAVTTVFGGGLRVGLLLNGKRVRDEGRTLLQTGLSEEDNINNLGFLLEPSSPSALPSSTMFPKASAILTTGDSSKDFVNSPPLTPREGKKLLDKSSEKTTLTGSAKVSGNTRQDLVPFAPHAELEKNPALDSRAVPENAGALAVIPASQRPRRSEIGQRRTRRPFSVSEVEALVQAVEKLGTGRWRDVKLCAFENAKHRTYVDLKDKWKTLVHTARISPQQRRGEPVPQELLDRVLAAHAYWSQHQAKQHGKQQLQHHNHHHSPVPIEKVAV